MKQNQQEPKRPKRAKPTLEECFTVAYMIADDLERMQLALVQSGLSKTYSEEALRRAAALRRLARTVEFVDLFGEKKFGKLVTAEKITLPEFPTLLEREEQKKQAQIESEEKAQEPAEDATPAASDR